MVIGSKYLVLLVATPLHREDIYDTLTVITEEYEIYVVYTTTAGGGKDFRIIL